MKTLAMFTLCCAGFGLLLASPATAAANTAKTAAVKTAAAATTMRTAWPPETLTGTIDQVVPGSQEVIVKDSGGVPFDILVTHNTRIRNGDQAVSLQNLQQDRNQSVSIRFTPESRGDVASSITIG